MLKNAIVGKKIQIFGGRQTVDLLHIDDATDAIIKSIDYKKSEIFNIGSGKNFSINQIANFFNVSKTYIPALKEPKASLADINKANKILGWFPSMDVEQWIKSNK